MQKNITEARHTMDTKAKKDNVKVAQPPKVSHKLV